MANAQPSQQRIELPHSAMSALIRGLRGQCPRCAQSRLFRNWLKPADTCPHCAQDWSAQQADDFPAYIGIFIAGHLLVPLAVTLIKTFGLSTMQTLAIILPLGIVMIIAMLQPIKGGVIANLWWFGIGNFVQERRSEEETEET